MAARSAIGSAAAKRFARCAVDCRDRRPRKTVRRLCGALTQWRTMTNVELVTAADVQLMQGLAQRVTATRPDLVNSDASFGELAGIWWRGAGRVAPGHAGRSCRYLERQGLPHRRRPLFLAVVAVARSRVCVVCRTGTPVAGASALPRGGACDASWA